MTTEQKEAVETMQHWIEYEKTHKDKINKADELIGIQETVLNLIQEQEEELKKKDNIIDELAKAFKQDDVRSVEEIKRFYERKVEDESDDKSTYGK